jgi:hypothetical protein
MQIVNVNQLILDYVAICEKRGTFLDVPDFVELWKAARDLADETEPDDRDMVLRRIFHEPE